MRVTLLVPLLLACSTVTSAEDEPAARLQGARSLHCTYTSSTTTGVQNGQQVVEQHHDKEAVVFDNIDLAQGTARIVPSDRGSPARHARVRWERSGGLWLVEQSLSGNLISTTVFPTYAPGTHEFVMLESRHSTFGTTATGVSNLEERQYGTCRVVE